MIVALEYLPPISILFVLEKRSIIQLKKSSHLKRQRTVFYKNVQHKIDEPTHEIQISAITILLYPAWLRKQELHCSGSF